MSGRLAYSGDTIVAPASGRGRAAVAVVRISGGRTRFALETIAGSLGAPRIMALRRLRDPRGGEVLDRALVAWFPGPASFTGEDMAELFTHGGPAVLSAVLSALAAVEGVRLAEPGEFARRAVLNGKLDLAAAEALGDLVEAETQAQRRQAMRNLDGALGRTVARWREELIGALALVEADLDFSDEGDVSEGLVETARARARAVHAGIARTLDDRSGERIREGFTVIIAGPPNAGKSTLLNHLAQRDVAIVSPQPGTTRDAIEVRCEIAGLPVLLVDTAGIRDSSDPVEREGVSRARDRIRQADIVLWLDPVDAPSPGPNEDGVASLRVMTKIDLAPDVRRDGQAVSAVTGEGVDALLDAIAARVGRDVSEQSGLITHARHREALEIAHRALGAAIDPGAKPGELIAEDLRIAVNAISRITGHAGAEDVLDRIFASFCIGK